jgi:hypothetical protein
VSFFYFCGLINILLAPHLASVKTQDWDPASNSAPRDDAPCDRRLPCCNRRASPSKTLRDSPFFACNERIGARTHGFFCGSSLQGLAPWGGKWLCAVSKRLLRKGEMGGAVKCMTGWRIQRPALKTGGHPMRHAAEEKGAARQPRSTGISSSNRNTGRSELAVPTREVFAELNANAPRLLHGLLAGCHAGCTLRPFRLIASPPSNRKTSAVSLVVPG